MAHLAQRLGLNLADAFAGDVECPADFFERARISVHQAEAQGEHFLLAIRQGLQDIADLFLERGQGVKRRLSEADIFLVIPRVFVAPAVEAEGLSQAMLEDIQSC